MPMYVYICDKCSMEEDIITSYEERDSEFECSQDDCDGKLVREEIADTAKMSSNWARW